MKGLDSLVYKLFDKNLLVCGVKSTPNQHLADELHKPIIRKFKRRKVYSSFKDSICSADLADMQLISKYNRGFRFLLCVIDIFSKYAWVVPLKDKKGATIIVDAFQSIFDDLERKPNKMWADQGSEFYYKSFKKWLDDNDIRIYSTNEGKSVVADEFIWTLKNRIYKHMIDVSKNVYFDVLDDIVDKYNNTYHRTIKIKPIDIKSSS